MTTTAPKPLPGPVGAWFQAPAWDLAAAAVAAMTAFSLAVWVENFGLQQLAPDTRRAVYQTVSTVTGTLLGLVLTSISVLNTVLKQPVEELTAKKLTPGRKRAVASLFFAAVRALAFGLIGSLSALIFDSDVRIGRAWAQALVVGIVILLVLRLSRALWALSLVVAGTAAAPAPAIPANRPPVTDDDL